MLKLRKRGETWHIRGTVRVGQKVWATEGETTGRRDKGEAQAVLVQRAHEIQADLIAGRDPALRHITFDTIARDYLRRPEGVDYADEDRIAALSDFFGDKAVVDLNAKLWREYCHGRLDGRSPGTWNRHRTVFVAVLERCRPVYSYPMPEIPAEAYDPVRVRFLKPEEERRLLGAYTGSAKDPLHFLAGTGRRTGETLKLDRRRDIDVARAEAFFPDPKGGAPQACALFPVALAAVKRALKRPEVAVRLADGTVWYPLFLNRFDEPYAVIEKKGGNPLRKAHETACKRAGIEDFHPHDWRHHFATWRLREGWQESQLMRQCGWESAEMLRKYAAVVMEDIHALVRRRPKKRTNGGQSRRKIA